MPKSSSDNQERQKARLFISCTEANGAGAGGGAMELQPPAEKLFEICYLCRKFFLLLSCSYCVVHFH